MHKLKKKYLNVNVKNTKHTTLDKHDYFILNALNCTPLTVGCIDNLYAGPIVNNFSKLQYILHQHINQ